MRCPVCKAVVDQGPQCRRCRADLSLLFDVESQARRARAAAMAFALQDRWDDALRMAEGALATHADVELKRLLTVLLLLRRDFAGAYQAYQQLKRAEV